MFNNENGGYSLADIAAATGNGRGGYGGSGGDGFFGGSGWWIILLFLFAWGGWGNNGWGGGGAGGTNAATTIYGLDNLGTTRTGFYDLNTGILNGFADTNSNIFNGFANTNAAIAAGANAIQSDISALGLQNCQSTNAITSAINSSTVSGMQNTFTLSTQLASMQAAQQLANCNTDQNVTNAFAQLNYNLATEACADRAAVTTAARDIIDNQNSNTRQILDFLVQDRITALTSENQALKGQISQSEQNAYLISQLRPCPMPAYNVPNPFGCNCNGNAGYYYGASNIIA